MQWEPPLEGACPVLAYNIYYRKLNSPRSVEGKRDLIRVDGSINHYTLQLHCSGEYEINVTSLNGHMESDSRQTWRFKTDGGKLKTIPKYDNRIFSNDDGDGNQDVKKAIGLLRKTTTLHVHHAFLYISLPSLHDYDVKMPNCKFYGGRKQATTNLFFSLLTWVQSSRNQL